MVCKYIHDQLVGGVYDAWWNTDFTLSFPIVNYGVHGYGGMFGAEVGTNMRWMNKPADPIIGDFIFDADLMMTDTYDDTRPYWPAITVFKAEHNDGRAGTAIVEAGNELVEVGFAPYWNNVPTAHNVFDLQVDNVGVEVSSSLTYVAWKHLWMRIKRVNGLITGWWKDGTGGIWTQFVNTKSYSGNIAIVCEGDAQLPHMSYDFKAENAFPNALPFDHVQGRAQNSFQYPYQL